LSEPYVFTDDFSDAAMRAEWRLDGGEWRVEKGALHLRGDRTSFGLALPDARYQAMELTFDARIEGVGGWGLSLGACRFGFGGNSSPESAVGRDQRPLARTERVVPRLHETHRYRFVARPGRVEMHVDGEEFLAADDPGGVRSFDTAWITAWGDIRVEHFRLAADRMPEGKVSPYAPADDFRLAVAVDFPDDLRPGVPFTAAMFESMFDHFAHWGVSHVDWIYRPSDVGHQYYHVPGRPWMNAVQEQTQQNVPDILGLVTKLAHERDMELHVQFKWFDFLGRRRRRDMPQALGSLPVPPRLGDEYISLPPELMHAPNALIRRHLTHEETAARQKTVKAIRLFNRTGQAPAFADPAVEVWVSDDNRTYRRYSGKVNISHAVEEREVLAYDHPAPKPTGEKESVHVITLSGLAIPEPYLAVRVPRPRGMGSFGNRLYALAELLDDDGRPIPFTWGLLSGVQASVDPEPADFRTTGIDFDTGPGMTGFLLGGLRDVMEEIRFVDNALGFLGFAKGKNPYVYALDPSEPCARQFWMRHIDECLERGVDGVDVRFRAHVKSLEWLAYGFNDPIVNAYRERHGVDIRSQQFDRGRWREVRGDFVTAFLRHLSVILRAAGKRLHVHVSCGMEPGPTGRTLYDMQWDWRKWLLTKIVDGITLKQVPIDSAMFHELKRLADERGVPIFETPFLWNYVKGPAWKERATQLIERARMFGLAGYMIYECATLLTSRQGEDRLFEKRPGTGDLLRGMFG